MTDGAPATLAELLLAWGVLPLLMLAGLADWACHRATAIERTGGLAENAVHWLMFGQIGAAALAAALLAPNAAVLAWVFAMFVAHEATAWLELRYAVARRHVRPVEQMVHSFQELLPLAGLALLAVAAARQPGALADWTPRWREDPVPLAALLAAGAAVLLVNILPLAEETLRCLRHRRAGGGGAVSPRTPVPPAPR